MPYGVPPYGLDQYGNPVDPDIGDLLYVELPGVYIDSLIFDEVSEGLFLFNAVPAEGTVENPRSTNIEFDIFETSGSEPNLTTLNVWINGIPAIAGGAFVAPFNGPASLITDNGNTVHVTIDPVSDFASEEIVSVHVECANDANTFFLGALYEFKIEDFTPPILLSAVPQSEKVIRLTFNESMNMSDPAETISTLNPENYEFEALTVPAVPVVAVSVSAFSDAVVDVHLDIEITPNATYKVTVTNAQDIHGNTIVP